MKNGSIATLQHVYFSYGEVLVLQDLNLDIKEKDFLTIIGPNGGGKTTILKLILGLISPERGTVTVFSKLPKYGRKHIGYVPQFFMFDLDFPISVLEVVLMGRLKKRGIGKQYSVHDREIAMNSLNAVGLADFKNRNIGDLSGGQRQRVYIARALSTEPRLLLLDEPVASVDTTWQQSFYDLLHRLNQTLTIVMVTHDISVVSTYIDKIACVNKKLFFHGSKKEGIQKISEMYECSVQLISHDIAQTENNNSKS